MHAVILDRGRRHGGGHGSFLPRAVASTTARRRKPVLCPSAPLLLPRALALLRPPIFALKLSQIGRTYRANLDGGAAGGAVGAVPERGPQVGPHQHVSWGAALVADDGNLARGPTAFAGGGVEGEDALLRAYRSWRRGGGGHREMKSWKSHQVSRFGAMHTIVSLPFCPFPRR